MLEAVFVDNHHSPRLRLRIRVVVRRICQKDPHPGELSICEVESQGHRVVDIVERDRSGKLLNLHALGRISTTGERLDLSSTIGLREQEGSKPEEQMNWAHDNTVVTEAAHIIRDSAENYSSGGPPTGPALS